MEQLTTRARPSVLVDRTIVSEHDYVWARLPFVVPMAVATARRRGDRTARELEQLVRVLEPLLLDHLGREEAMLVGRSAARVAARIPDRMHEDHVAVSALIDQIRVLAKAGYPACDGADPTERALHLELARLDAHLRAQIAAEERLLALRQRAAGDGS